MRTLLRSVRITEGVVRGTGIVSRHRRGFVAAAAAGVVFCQPAAALSEVPKVWNATVSTDIRIFSWDSVRQIPGAPTAVREHGTQVFVPVGLQVSGKPIEDWKFDFLARSGFISSNVTVGTARGSFDGATDSSVTGTTTYQGLGWFQPYFSTTLNLPTGQTVLRGADAGTRGDTDLALLPVFGEGFNIGPTLGANFLVNQSVVISLAGGYTDRGVFQREGPTILGVPTNDRLNPGDVTTATATIGYRGERLSLKGSLAYSLESMTTLNGQPFYQSGDRIIALAAAGYAFDEHWSAKGQVTFSHFEKNKVRFVGIPVLMTEYFNTNSNTAKVVADLTYANNGWSVGPVATYFFRDRNGYDPTAFQFVTAKTAWTGGLAGSFAPTEATRITMRLEHLWAYEDDSPNKVQNGFTIPLSGNPSVRTHGWVASIAGVIRF
jgi:hypothetical protein